MSRKYFNKYITLLYNPGRSLPRLIRGNMAGATAGKPVMFEDIIKGIAGLIAIGLVLYIGVMIFTHLPK